MAYVEADSYTTVSRVEELVARGSYSGSTKPSGQGVLDRMAQQAAVVTAVILNAGGSVPLTSGSTVAKLADEANAFLAAAYVLCMHENRDLEKPVFAEYIKAADRILYGDPANDIPGSIAVAVESDLGGSAFVNDLIEIEREDLLHVTEMRF